MAKYVWQHDLEGEEQRLRLMSKILDPSSRAHLSGLPLPDDCKGLEIGAGNGSVSQWLAAEFRPNGNFVATDLDPKLMNGTERPNLAVRPLDIVKDKLEEDAFDLVFLRALLHHLPTRMDVIAAMAKAVKPGGWVFIQEPDFYPTMISEPKDEADFWIDFLNWSDGHQIDYYIGRKVAPKLQSLGMENISAIGQTQLYNGGSHFARWWQQSIAVVADRMLSEGGTTEKSLDRFFALYDDPAHWTMTIAFTCTSAQRPLA